MVGRRSGRARLDLHRGAPVPEPAGASSPTAPALGLHRPLDRGAPGRAATRRDRGRSESIGIDTWAVDYGLLDGDGRLLGEPVPLPRRPHRRASSSGSTRVVAARELYAVNGLQFLPFNTLYQLAAERGSRLWRRRRTSLLLPDLVATGSRRVGAERTNASTTGLLDVRTGDWANDLLDGSASRRRCCPRSRDPGDAVGALPPGGRRADGLRPATPVVAVGSHDTASAVVAVPADGEPVRLHLVRHVVAGRAGARRPGAHRGEPGPRTSPTRAASTARIRFLRNVDGPVAAQESLRDWAARGEPDSRAAARRPRAAGRSARWSTSTTPVPAAGRHAGADRGGLRAHRAAPCPRRPAARSAASSTASPLAYRRDAAQAAAADRPRRRRRSTSSAAARATSCSASSPPTLRPAGARRAGRGDRARQRPGPGPGASASTCPTSLRCAGSCGPPSPWSATTRRVTATRGTPRSSD